MKRLVNSLLLLLFMLGVLTFPTIHKAHCSTAGAPRSEQAPGHSDQPSDTSHNSHDCIVCQLAAMPFISSPILTGPCAIAARPVARTPAFTAPSSSTFSLFDSPPTGPPAARK